MKPFLQSKDNSPEILPLESGAYVQEIDLKNKGKNFRIDSYSIVVGLMIVVFVLVTLSLIGTIVKHSFGSTLAYYFFNLDTEGNAPSFFSSIILLFSGFLFRIIALHKKSLKDPFFIHWLILSFSFFYLALDESISIHEKLIYPLRELLNLSGFFYYSWVVVGSGLLLIFLFSYFKFFLSLSTEFKKGFFTAGTIYVLGLIGMEMVGGYYTDTNGKDMTYEFVYAVEETLEMVGIVYLINVLFKYIKKNIGRAKFIFA